MAVELIRGAGIELLTSPEMTGQWERRLNEISRGTASDEQFMHNVKRFATLIVDKVRVQARASKTAFEGETPAAGGNKRGSTTRANSPASSGAGSTKTKAAPKKSAEAKTSPSDGGSTFLATCPRPGCGGSLYGA